MNDDPFQWDTRKAAENYTKHRVTFEMARDVFDDPFLVEWLDDSQGAREPRFAALGMVEGRILFVAYAMKGDDIRIISARRAEAFERRRYHDENKT